MKPRWQQATALVSLSTAGAMTGIAFAHGTAADLTSPASMPAHLLAFKKPGGPAASGDSALRSAIVSAAQSFLRLAQGKTPAEMEALIWQDDSTNGADHGASCAAFASLTLEAGAHAIGQQSWVTGGTSYPWPLHQWADVRVDPNPQSPGIISILQDAQAHQRWHPLGDGYVPQPGDWVLFDGHVEVVTKYSGGVLYTIGGDSMPNLSVNAHQYDAPLGAQGVAGFVDNGELPSAQSQAPAVAASISAPGHARPERGQADIPGLVAAAGGLAAGGLAQGSASHSGQATGVQAVLLGTAAIPGAQANTGGSGGSSSNRYSRSQVTPSAQQDPGTAAQQAFIQEVAPGALAAQRAYGVPAAVTIAQAIDESGWGQSQLAAQDNNLFGIKGSGPAGSVMLPTQEFENGEWVTISAPFRTYNSVAQSINDHSLLLATGSSYKQAMADRADPDVFANDLTGVYATDPNYGTSLISIMRLYNLYRFDAGSQAAPHAAASAGSVMGAPARADTQQSGTGRASGALPEAAQGVAGYGPTLGTEGIAMAIGNLALQGTSSKPAAVPGVAAPSGTVTGRERHGASGPGSARPRQHGTQHPRSRSAARGTARPGVTTVGAARQSTTSAVAAGPSAPTSAGAAAARDATVTAAGSGEVGPRAARGTPAQSGSTGGTATAGGTQTGGRAAGGSRTGARAASGSRTGGRAAGGSGTGATGYAGGRTTGSSGAGGTRAGARAAGGGGTGGSRGQLASTAGAGAAQLGSTTGGSAAQLGSARIPGLVPSRPGAGHVASGQRSVTAGARNARVSTRRYVTQFPQAVTTAFITTAKTPLLRSQPLYRDVASHTGVSWQLLAACDWMQCRAQPGHSAVYGEKLGTKNADGTVYRTRADALLQCARDLIILSSAVYAVELTDRMHLSVRDLSKVFAAFRWGGLLTAHRVSALDFPYSVQGLTARHMKMRWPDVPDAPGSDKPGTRFPLAFGAVPVVLGLDYRALA
jgi:flagellum-specific peptidoglycan hydrolase FlgJ